MRYIALMSLLSQTLKRAELDSIGDMCSTCVLSATQFDQSQSM